MKATCSRCGAVEAIPKDRRAPTGWFYMLEKDTLFACSSRCADLQWLVGPGPCKTTEESEPEEAVSPELGLVLFVVILVICALTNPYINALMTSIMDRIHG